MKWHNEGRVMTGDRNFELDIFEKPINPYILSTNPIDWSTNKLLTCDSWEFKPSLVIADENSI